MTESAASRSFAFASLGDLVAMTHVAYQLVGMAVKNPAAPPRRALGDLEQPERTVFLPRQRLSAPGSRQRPWTLSIIMVASPGLGRHRRLPMYRAASARQPAIVSRAADVRPACHPGREGPYP